MLRSVIFTTCLIFSSLALSQSLEIDRRIHDEIETSGGYSLGLGQGGMAAVSDMSSVRMNPAMIGIEKTYSLFGGYHWPTFGRDFYQAGVVDSKTSAVAAAFLYSGFNDDFDLETFDELQGKDSTLHRRLGVGLSQVVGKLSAGLSVFFIEGYKVDESTLTAPKREKMTTFGLGIAGFVTPTVRFGLSGENLGNKKMPEIAPRFLRAGLAFLFAKGKFSAHLDYINRQRIEGVEYNVAGNQQVLDNGLSVAQVDNAEDDLDFRKNEQMVVGSFSLRVYDLVRILGSYGGDFDTGRQSMSGGIAIVNNQYSLSYSSSRPYMTSASAHQAINLGMQISM